MRLANRSYTQVKVEISEGLGGGSRHTACPFPLRLWKGRDTMRPLGYFMIFLNCYDAVGREC